MSCTTPGRRKSCTSPSPPSAIPSASWEKELGVKLFEKENRKISLTAYGEQFLPYVQRSLALLDEGAAVLEQMAGNLPQVAKLGYFHSISASLIPALVEGFYREEDNRSIRFQFTEGPSFDIFNQVKAGELDMAFGMHRDDWAESVIIMRQPLYLAVPSDHPLAARHSVTFDDFAREPQVMLDKPSSLRTQMDRIFAQRGAVPNVVFEVRECNAALQYVALKFPGCQCFPRFPAMDTEKVSIIPISDQDKEFRPHGLSLLVPLPPHVSRCPEGCGTIS